MFNDYSKKLLSASMIIFVLCFFFLITFSFLLSGSSDKEQDCSTPEKLARPSSERKRKRKVADDGGLGSGGLTPTCAKGGPRLPVDSKKINDYFVKHPGSSPIRHGGGAKSPSPAQQGYPMVSNLKVDQSK